jgi:RNA polymerase sigma factor (TIGR02999 family)
MCAQGEDFERVLAAWQRGDRSAVEELFRLVYGELRTVAGRQLRGRRAGETLGPTALVHEVYLRFAARSSPDLLDRNHFVALATSAMRMVIVDHWRRKRSQKRDPQAPLSGAVDDVPAPYGLLPIDILALDEALRRLSELDGRQAQVVELRFFGGLAVDEIAGILGVTERTVKRDWHKARAFLYHAMRSETGNGA